MELDVAQEIIEQILPQIRDTPSDLSLNDLRIAFTCRAFYRALIPLLAKCHSNLVRIEMERGNLDFLDASGAPLSQDCIDISTVEDLPQALSQIAQVRFEVTPYESTDAIWSLHSFLSRENVANRLSRIDLTLHPAPQRSLAHDIQPDERKRWRRALLKLVQLVMPREGFELEFTGSNSKGAFYPPFVSSLEGFIHDTRTTTRLRPASLVLSGSLTMLTLAPITHSYFQFICSHSRSYLTHLHLNFPTEEESGWSSISYLLKFDKLSHLSFGGLTMPPEALKAILERNPTVTSMSINKVEPINYIPKPPWVCQPLRGEKVAAPVPHEYSFSNILTLACHPRMLLALFRTSFSFPNLETLIVCGYSSVSSGHYCSIWDITELLIYLGQDQKPKHSKPFSLRLDLPYERSPGLKSWFESGRHLSPGELASTKGTAIVRAFKGLGISSKPTPTPTPSSTSDSSPRHEAHYPMTLSLALRRLHNLKSLTLVAQKFSKGDPLPHAEGTRRLTWPLDVPPKLVARFIAALPAVKDVTLHSIFHDLKPGQGDEGLNEIRKEMGKVWKMSKTVERITIFDYGHGELSGRTEVLVRP